MMQTNLKVLLIEDNPNDADLIESYLSKSQQTAYTIEVAGTLNSGLAALATRTPDIVLVDLTLPDASGVAAVEHITQAGYGVPVIVMTGQSDEQTEMDALHAGAQDFVDKSIENYRLLPRILRFSLERHQILIALQESENRYRMLSEISSDYMFSSHFSADGKPTQDWTTGALEEITGYTIDEYIAIGGWPAIVHPDDQWIDDQDMLMLHQNKEVHSELRIIKKDGSVSWVQVKGIPIWDDEKECAVGVYGSTLEITKRKLGEIERAQSEQRFKTMFSEAPIGIGLTDAHTFVYLNVNQYFAEMVGYSTEELLTMTWVEITHPEDVDLDKTHMIELNEGKIDTFEIEKRYLRKDGTIIWVNMKVVPVTLGETERPCVLSMVEDITEQKRQHQQLAESENRFRTIYQHAPMPYQSLNEQGLILDVNNAWLQELEYEKNEVIGQYFGDFLTEEGAEIFPQRFAYFKKTGEVHDVEFQMRKKEGGIIDVTFDGRIVRDEVGKFIQTHCVFTNITARKQAELTRQRDLERLESLTAILQYPYKNRVDFLDFVLNEATELTNSKLGYIYFYDEESHIFELNAWSKEVMAECKIIKPQITYQLENTGIWGEAVRQRKAIVVNDFQAPNPLKRDYPEGHIELSKFLTVPVFSGEKIVAVIGVANKETDYDHQDELQLTLLMNNVWKVVERERLQAELADVNFRMQHYIESSEIILFAYDIESNQSDLIWNSANTQQIIGYTPDEIRQRDWWQNNLMTEGVLTLHEYMLWDQSGQDFYEQDFRFKHKNGDVMWINERFRFLRDADGKPTEVILSWMDITNRKQMEETLRQTTIDLNRAQSVSHVGSWKWHIPTNELTWSDEMYRIFGIDKATFTGFLPDVVSSAIHPDDRAEVEASNSSVIDKNKPIPLEYRVVHPDGTIRTVWAEAGDILFDHEGNSVELSGIVMDITERKAAETQLLLQDEALNSTANSIVITDTNGNIQWANPAFTELTGFTVAETTGKNPRELVFSGIHDIGFYQKLWETILDGHIWRGELINKRKDGSLYNEYMTITPIKTNGVITNFVAIKEDITLRKEQEARIERHLRIQEKLVAMGRAFGALIDVQMIYRTAYRYIYDIIEVPNMGITLIDPEDHQLHREFAVNDGIVLDVSHFGAVPYTPDDTSAYRSSVIASQQPIITNELEAKTQHNNTIFIGTQARKTQSAIYVPMIAEGKSLGVIELQSYERNAFTQQSSEWLSVVANQIALAVQNARLYDQIRKRISQLNGLREIDTSINAHHPLLSIFQLVMNQVRFHIRPDAADILLCDEETGTIIYQAGYGYRAINPESISIQMGCGLAGTIVKTGRQIEHFGDGMPGGCDEDCQKWNMEKFESYIGLPITINNQVVGVLEVFHRSTFNLNPEWMQYLETLAGQVAIAIENNDLISNLQQTADDLMKAYDATIEGWSQAMDLRDRETEGHTQRVTHLTKLLAQVAGIPDDQWPHIRRGALLHDIGKLGVPDEILHKPAALSPEEWEIMQQHPIYAYEMLKDVEYLQPALEIPLYHHEKWDGSGYPQGLAGTDIPLTARVFALVDVWDAVTNDRPYKQAWSKEKARQLILDGAGSHFDPELADLFIQIVDGMEP